MFQVIQKKGVDDPIEKKTIAFKMFMCLMVDTLMMLLKSAYSSR